MAGTGTQTNTSSLFFKTSGYTVDAIQFDLLLDEQHSMESEVTSHPVEDGSQINDHIQIRPRSGSLTGFVTNHPLDTGFRGGLPKNIAQKIAASQKSDFFAGFVQDIAASYSRVLTAIGAKDALAFTDADFASLTRPNNRVQTVFDAFEELIASKKVCTIQTGLKKYVDVVVTKVDTIRDKDTGDAGRFKVTFQEVRFVTLSEIALGATVRPNFNTDAGKQAGKKAKKGKVAGKVIPYASKAALAAKAAK